MQELRAYFEYCTIGTWPLSVGKDKMTIDQKSINENGFKMFEHLHTVEIKEFKTYSRTVISGTVEMILKDGCFIAINVRHDLLVARREWKA